MKGHAFENPSGHCGTGKRRGKGWGRKVKKKRDVTTVSEKSGEKKQSTL